MQCPSRIRSGVREAAPWQGPGRGPLWAPLQRTQDPLTTKPCPCVGLPLKQRLRLLLSCSSLALKKGWAGARLEAAAQAQGSGLRLRSALPRGLPGILQEPLPDSLCPVREAQAWERAQGEPDHEGMGSPVCAPPSTLLTFLPLTPGTAFPFPICLFY